MSAQIFILADIASVSPSKVHRCVRLMKNSGGSKVKYQTMNLATKKVATVLVGSVLVLALSFAFVTPAKADLLSELQAQVQALLAQISALGGTTSTSGAGCYSFTMTHQQGDTGGEVMWVQKFLNSHGAQVAVSGAGSAGNETAYYGAMTKAAVAKWQAANGVSPAAGYWGPVTRAKVASVCASAPTTPGTPTTPGGEVLNGTAGSITITSTSVDVEDQVFTGTTEKVLGFKVEASGSDVRVTNIRVRFTAAVDSSASDRLADYFDDISIWANGNKIASMAPSSFVRDSSGVYSASIPVAHVIRMGSGNKVTFHVGATARDSIDSDNDGSTNDWTAALVQTRYTDPTGATLFDTTAASNAGVYVDRLSTSSDVKLRMAEGSGNPKTGNRVADDGGTTDVTLLEFTLKAEGADMEFDTLLASTTLSGVDTMDDMVQEFYLMRGSTQVAEEAAITTASTPFQVLSFNLDDEETIDAGETVTYKIVAKVKTIGTGSSATLFDQGDSITASTSPSVGSIDAKSVSDGKSVTNRAGSVTGYTQTLFSEGVSVTKVGESFTLLPNDTAANVAGEFKVTLRVTNIGSNDVYIPLTSLASTTANNSDDGVTLVEGINFYMTDGTTATTSSVSVGTLMTGGVSLVSGGVEKTSSVLIAGGSSADLMLTTSFNPTTDYSGTRQYRVQILSVGHSTADDATPESIVETTPLSDFRTSFNTIQN